MTIQQVLMVGDNFIDPTYAVGVDIFAGTNGPRTFTGNGVGVPIFIESLSIPKRWRTKRYRYEASVTSIEDYICIGSTIRIFKNDVEVYQAVQPASNLSYWRYNTGTLNFSFELDLSQDDEVRMELYITGRAAGGETPLTSSSFSFKRIT